MVASGHLYRYTGTWNGNLTVVPGTDGYHRKAARKSKGPPGFPRIAYRRGGKNQAEDPGLGIFLTCRQVYLESISLFFSRNSFIFSRVRCAYNTHRWFKHDDLGHFISRGADWMVRLGSQLSKLGQIEIDLGVICHVSQEHEGSIHGYEHVRNLYWRYDIGPDCIEVLPLLRVLWAREWTGKIQFGFYRDTPCPVSSSGFRYFVEGTYNKKPYTRDSNFEGLDKILERLREDDLHIKRSARLACHIGIRSGWGFALFRSTDESVCLPGGDYQRFIDGSSNKKPYHPCRDDQLSFRLDVHDRLMKESPLFDPLTELPEKILERIQDYVIRNSEIISVDLREEKDRVPGYTFVHKDESMLEKYYADNCFALDLKSVPNTHDIFILNQLDSYLARGASYRAKMQKLVRGFKNRNVVSLNICCESPPGKFNSLAEIRIDVTSLVRDGPRGKKTPTKLHIGLWHVDSNQDRIFVEGVTLPLWTMYTAVLQAFRRLRQIDSRYVTLERAEVQIDGYGTPVAYRGLGGYDFLPFPWL